MYNWVGLRISTIGDTNRHREGYGRGLVGRAVAFNTKYLQFESSHSQFLYDCQPFFKDENYRNRGKNVEFT